MKGVQKACLSAHGAGVRRYGLRSIRSTWTHPNYVLTDRAVERRYTLLRDALWSAGYTTLAQWTLHSHEHLVLLRPGRFALLVDTDSADGPSDRCRDGDDHRHRIRESTST
jgi:non-homologous end joining protein Ku